MSVQYNKIEQNIFRNVILKKLNKEELQKRGYKTVIQNNYTYNRVNSEYSLNEGIEEPVLKSILHIFKTIGFYRYSH